ncbi:helix-turn-helix domain-containing protein [Ligilactobacillus murinus]|uniref:helix-turn-helix domain-containing protein n=1 Tax=Ligilactobacillus murinus TaxID=1622 RepID=UPI002DD61A98|nr:helix-turn-helix domain-containing protein [Ligilactobacillus murinus]WRY37114.1 helix-turn-helix domain-containing protein [Ligilactobacillus murinus]
MAEQEFTGVRLFLNIPAEVAHDPRFKSDKSILLFGEIFSMLNVTGSFFMSNKEMAKRIRAKSEKTVQNCLSELEKLGYIKREIITDKKSGKVIGRGKITSPYCNRFIGGVTDYAPPCNEIHPGGVTDYAIKEQYNKSSNNNVQKQLEEDFEKLWKLYPKKSGKPKAFSAYKRAIKKGVTNKEIQTGIVKYLTQIKVQGTTKEYIKNGSTWFNQECWNDEYNLGQEKSPVNPKTVPSSAPAERTVADLEREQRESRRDAFPIQYKEHPEWFNEETIKNILEEFPELREVVAEIDRARAKSDRNTA